MKRIKRVFTNKNQVLHLWANQSQDSARCSNVFFEGKSCYSYGYHYELGRLIEFNGHTVALINDTRYSNTTSKHQKAAWDATSHLIRVFTDDFSDVRGSLVKLQDRLLDELFGLFSRRSQIYYKNFSNTWIHDNITDFNVICLKLGFYELTLDIDADFFDLYSDLKEYLDYKDSLKNSPEALAKREIERQKREARLLEKVQDRINEWRNFERNSISYEDGRRLNYHLLRVKNGVVQTSGGAEVPLSHALRLLKLVENDQAKSGERIGHFTFNSINNGVVRIGCHNIELSEAKAVLAPYKTQFTLISNGEAVS